MRPDAGSQAREGGAFAFAFCALRSNNNNLIIISNNNLNLNLNLLLQKQAGMCYLCCCRASALGLLCVCFVTLLCLPASGSSVQSLPFNPHSQQQTTGNGNGNGSIPAQQQSVIVETTTTTRKESCEVNVPEQLSPAAVASACGTLDRERCCPVLAAWVYAARASALLPSPAASASPAPAPPETAMMPAVPEDAGACAGAVERALARRGVQLPRANDSCDAVQCVCGIRAGVRRFSWSSCSNASPRRLHRLQRDCHALAPAPEQAQLSISCSACLRSLRQLSGNDIGTMQKVASSGSGMEENADERTIIVRRRECELMGLTWLLGRNSSAYISTVAAVLRSTMYNSLVATTHSYDATTCFAGAADRRSMPLPVDSSQLGQTHSSASAASDYTVSLAAAAAILASGFFSILFRFQVI